MRPRHRLQKEVNFVSQSSRRQRRRTAGSDDDDGSSDDGSSEEEEAEEAVPQMGDAACEALFKKLKAHVKILIAEFPAFT